MKSFDKGNEDEGDVDTEYLKMYSKDVKCYGDVLAILLEICPHSYKIPQVSMVHAKLE